MEKNPLVILVMLGVGLYLGKLWRDDLRKAHASGFPGASAATPRAVIIAIAGALLLLLAETVGEKWLGIAAEQSTMTWLFAAYSVLAAPILEELVFRGYCVIAGKGKGVLWLGIIVFSIGFALLHPFLQRGEGGGFSVILTTKGVFSTTMAFAISVWLYAARFGPWNRTQSLSPCFAAHAAKNAGVVIVKAASGYMGGLW
jgi:membrane protease YdiL (CAAX protease family)